MYLMVWMVKGLPDRKNVPDDWKVTVIEDPPRMILHHKVNSHSTCLLLLVDYKERQLFGPHLIKLNRRLIGSKEIPQNYVDNFRNLFPQRLINI